MEWHWLLQMAPTALLRKGNCIAVDRDWAMVTAMDLSTVKILFLQMSIVTVIKWLRFKLWLGETLVYTYIYLRRQQERGLVHKTRRLMDENSVSFQMFLIL